MATQALTLQTRHGFSYDQWLSAARRPRGGKRLHAAWWRGESPESHRARENPVGGGAVAFIALLSVAAGGLATFLVSRYIAKRAAVTDPVLVTQAQINLESLTSQGAKMSPPTPALVPYQHQPSTIGVTTPDFTTSVASFQAWVNANGQGVVASVSNPDAAPQVGRDLVLPLRTDGVLDPATFNWLVVASTA